MIASRIVRCAALALALCAGGSAALGQVGSAFTYQGQLKDNGQLKNTAVNLEMRLFTLANGGTQVGGTFSATTTPVDGLFTVNADFGVDPFTSDTALFIEVRVRDAGNGPFTTLPRQRLRAAPYSLATRGLAVASNGFVGIGTQSPSDRLTVVQNAYGIAHKSVDGLSDVTTYVDNSGGWVGTVAPRPLHFYTGNSFQQMTLTTSGDVGIGTTSPGATLDVHGNVMISAFGDLFFQPPTFDSDEISLFRGSFGPDESGLFMVIGDNPSGASLDRFVIGTRATTSSPVEQRFVFRSDGQAFKAGSGSSWGTLSDRRVKHDIKDLSGALDSMMALKGKTFYYNNPDALGAAPGLRMGFIAQEVETVFPDWVGQFDAHTKTLNLGGGSFEALTVEAVRELRSEKDSQIAALKAANEALEARLARLEAALAAGLDK